MQAKPNNSSLSNKMLASIVALLAAGTIGGYTVGNITTQKITTGTFSATSTLSAPNVVASSTRTDDLTIGGGQTITKHLNYSVTVPETVVGIDTQWVTTTTLTIPGALPTDSFAFTPSLNYIFPLSSSVLIQSYVATDTLELVFANTGNATTTLATSTVQVDLWRH